MDTWYDSFSKTAQFATQPREGVLSIPSSVIMKELRAKDPELYEKLHGIMRGSLEGGVINELLGRLERQDIEAYAELMQFVFSNFPKKSLLPSWIMPPGMRKDLTPPQRPAIFPA
jgi:hypothetical protein